MRARGRSFGSLFLVLVMMASFLALAHPSAAAAESSFARDVFVGHSESCPDGTREVGRPDPNHPVACRPDGFIPIRTEALCDSAVEAGVFGLWVAGDPVSLCIYGYTMPVPDAGCWGVTIESTLMEDPFAGLYACFHSVLVRAGIASSFISICLDDAVLLADEDAAELEVGSFYEVGEARYVLTTGERCGFGCVDGFDINCDGELGDYCPSAFDHRTVAGAKACLAAITSVPAAVE